MIHDLTNFPTQTDLDEKFISIFRLIDNSNLVYMTNTNYLNKLLSPLTNCISTSSNFSFFYTVTDPEGRHRLREIELVSNFEGTKHFVLKVNLLGDDYTKVDSRILEFPYKSILDSKHRDINTIDFLKIYCRLTEKEIHNIIEKCKWNIL